VLFATSNDGALAAKQATATIPIVFGIGGDPVALGLVASLGRPGGNITGIYFFTQGLEAKRLGVLHEMVPKATTIAVLINPNYSPAESQLRDVQEAAARLGVRLVVVRANAESDFDPRLARRSSSSPRHSSTAGASSLSCWPLATRCRRSMNGASSRQPAV